MADMLRQSIELGTVGRCFRAFSDDMRHRLLRAEERANQLPAKMVGRWACSYFRFGIATLPVNSRC